MQSFNYSNTFNFFKFDFDEEGSLKSSLLGAHNPHPKPNSSLISCNISNLLFLYSNLINHYIYKKNCFIVFYQHFNCYLEIANFKVSISLSERDFLMCTFR